MSKVFWCLRVYSSILGGRVTLCPEWIKEASCDTARKEHGEKQRERSLYSPKRQKRQGQEAETIQSTHHRQWPSSCSKQDQGDLWEAKPVQPVWAINSTLLSAHLISLSCCSSTHHERVWLMPKQGWQGEAAMTPVWSAMSRCLLIKKREKDESQRSLWKKKWSDKFPIKKKKKTSDHFLHYWNQHWLLILPKLAKQLSSLSTHAEVLKCFLLFSWSWVKGFSELSRDLDVIVIMAEKETMKLSKLKKVLLLTFTFELMWPALMLLRGLTQPQK